MEQEDKESLQWYKTRENYSFQGLYLFENGLSLVCCAINFSNSWMVLVLISS
jgi:hypothetical protein